MHKAYRLGKLERLEAALTSQHQLCLEGPSEYDLCKCLIQNYPD